MVTIEDSCVFWPIYGSGEKTHVTIEAFIVMASQFPQLKYW